MPDWWQTLLIAFGSSIVGGCLTAGGTWLVFRQQEGAALAREVRGHFGQFFGALSLAVSFLHRLPDAPPDLRLARHVPSLHRSTKKRQDRRVRRTLSPSSIHREQRNPVLLIQIDGQHRVAMVTLHHDGHAPPTSKRRTPHITPRANSPHAPHWPSQGVANALSGAKSAPSHATTLLSEAACPPACTWGRLREGWRPAARVAHPIGVLHPA
jgi:hypothetical protein